MTYTTKICPFCKQPYEHYSSVTKGSHFGSPFITCKKCGKTFIDKEMEELALKPFSETEKRYSPLKRAAALWNIFTLMFILLSYVIFSGNMEIDYSLSSILVLLLYAGCGLFTLHIIKTITIDKDKIADAFKEEYSKSEKRLSNIYYALALKQAGYSVPDKYLQLPVTEIDPSEPSMENEYIAENTSSNTSENNQEDRVKIKIKRKTK